MRKFTLLLCIATLMMGPALAPAQCVIDTLVPRVPGIYPDTIPPLVGCNYGEVDLTFIIPRDTTVNILGQTLVVPFESFTITSVTGLPLGMTWECNLAPDCIYDVGPNNPNPDTIGCIRISGTPIIPGVYPLLANLDVDVGAFGIQQGAFRLLLTVGPCVFSGSCYDLVLTSTCEPGSLTLSNNIPSNGNPGFSYQWEVTGPGLNYVTSDENPQAQSLAQPGTYYVDYEAQVDTTGFIMDSIVIEAVNCNDVLVGVPPDLYWYLINPAGDTLVNTSANPLSDFNNFPLNIGFPMTVLDTGTYEFQVWDDDTTSPDDGCADGQNNGNASVFLTIPALNGGPNTVISGGLRVTFHLNNPITTITCADTLQIDPLPNIPDILVMSDTFFCEGDSLMLTTIATDSLQWFKDGFPIASAGDVSLVVKEGGSYTLQAIDPLTRCTRFSSAVILTQVSLPRPSIGLSGTVFSVAGPDPDYDYEWYLNGSLLGSGDTLHARGSGTYWAVAVDKQSGCRSDTSGSILYTATGIDDLSGLVEAFSIYPNPSEGQFALSLDLREAREIRLSLFDLVGKAVYVESLGVRKGIIQQEVTVLGLPSGVYLLRLELGREVINKKVVIR